MNLGKGVVDGTTRACVDGIAHGSVRHDRWGFEMWGWAVMMWVGMSVDAHADIEQVSCDASHGSVLP